MKRKISLKIQAVETSYLRSACGVKRMYGESNEIVDSITDLVCEVKVKEWSA